jgi:hypothetical protein
MSIRRKAEEFFHQKPENLNSVQSILKGFQAYFGISECLIDSFRTAGGGRNPEGCCGALYAANMLLQKIGEEPITKEFVERAGGVTCFQIFQANKIACEQCVSLADELLEKRISAR